MSLERRMPFVIVAIAVLITATFMLIGAGKHPETLLYEPTTILLIVEVIAIIGVAVILSYFLKRFVSTRIYFSTVLMVMSLLFAGALLIVLPKTGRVLAVAVDDSLWCLTVFCMGCGLVGGFAHTGNKLGLGWLIFSLIAIAQFVYFVLLMFAMAMGHWH